MRQLAASHGQAGWHAHAFPLSVDGIEIVASLVLLADRRCGRRSGWLPWAALVIGTTGSLAANIATAGPDAVSRVIAGWPALALLIAVKLLSGMFGHSRSFLVSMPGSCRAPASPAAVMAAVPAEGPDVVRRLGPDRADVPARETVPDIGALLPVARMARDRLESDGRALTRDTPAAWLREHGHPVSNSRLTPLLRALRDDAEAA
jgi:hypothetical protein